MLFGKWRSHQRRRRRIVFFSNIASSELEITCTWRKFVRRKQSIGQGRKKDYYSFSFSCKWFPLSMIDPFRRTRNGHSSRERVRILSFDSTLILNDEKSRVIVIVGRDEYRCLSKMMKSIQENFLRHAEKRYHWLTSCQCWFSLCFMSILFSFILSLSSLNRLAR